MQLFPKAEVSHVDRKNFELIRNGDPKDKKVKALKKRLKGANKYCGVLPAPWRPKLHSQWAEVFNALKPVKRVVAMRDVDGTIGCACQQLGIKYDTFAESEEHRTWLLKRLDQHMLEMMATADGPERIYQGDEASKQIKQLFAMDSVAADDGDDDVESDSSSATTE